MSIRPEFEGEDRYINNFKEREAILVERYAIRPNKAERALGKLCLNPMWGKLTQIIKGINLS